MSEQRFPVATVGMDYFDRASYRFTAKEIIKATPQQIFDAFEDADAWPEWAGPIQKVEWTSPKPFGLGTTRTVYMSGGMVGWEVFIAWESGKRMAFCFTHAAQDNIESFAEDYQVEDLGDGSCRVRWTMAMDPKGFSKYAMVLFKPVMGFMVRRMFGGFRKLVESRVAAAESSPA